MQWNHWLCLAILLCPTSVWAQEEGEPGPCAVWDLEEQADSELNPVVHEGILALTAAPDASEEDCSGPDISEEDLTSFVQITVTDDDGEIPGEAHVRTHMGVILWVPSASSDRLPTSEKNAQVTVQLAQTVGNDGETTWAESQSYPLEVLLDSTPPPSAPILDAPEAQLSPRETWQGERLEGNDCHLPRLVVGWEAGEQPPGAKYLSIVEITEGTPDGTDRNGLVYGTSGSRSRDFLEYSEEYCMALELRQAFLGNPAAVVEPVCASHQTFTDLLPEGQSFCFDVPEDEGSPSDSPADPEATGADGQSDEGGGCHQAGHSPVPAAFVFWLLLLAFLHRQSRPGSRSGSQRL